MADDDKDISKQAWLSEPFTQRMAHLLNDIQTRRLSALLDTCRKSADPDVVKAFSSYEGILFMRELFTKGEFRDG